MAPLCFATSYLHALSRRKPVLVREGQKAVRPRLHCVSLAKTARTQGLLCLQPTLCYPTHTTYLTMHVLLYVCELCGGTDASHRRLGEDESRNIFLQVGARILWCGVFASFIMCSLLRPPRGAERVST